MRQSSNTKATKYIPDSNPEISIAKKVFFSEPHNTFCPIKLYISTEKSLSADKFTNPDAGFG
jgi:hypothetical protein